MASVRIGLCYGVPAWDELEPRRRGGGRHAALYSLNVRLADFQALLRLLRDPYSATFGRQAIAVWIEFVELVARSPLRGRAVYRDGPLLVAMDDRYLAGLLGLPIGGWQEIARALLCGSGVGVLECVEVRIDVEDDRVRSAYQRREAGGDQLPLFQPLRRTEPNERRKEETEPNRTEPNRIEPNHPTGERGRRAYDVCRRLCLSSTEATSAADAFVAMLTELLGEPSDRDVEQWHAIFHQMWGGSTDTGRDRAMRVELAAREAIRIAACSNVRKPPALFCKWARGQGLLGPSRRARVTI